MIRDDDGADVQARVDLSAIRDNVRWMAGRTSAEIMAMVKADGYGHGLVASGWAALAGGATWLGTAFVAEALSLRAAGIEAPVLSCLVGVDDDLVAAVRDGVDLSLSGRRALEDAARAARLVGRPARVHLEVDTGMGRGGVVLGDDWYEVLADVARYAAEEFVQVVGIWTHLACADERDHPANRLQLAAYGEALRVARRVGVVPQMRHAANSPATLHLPESHYDLVRLGAAVYGLSPFEHPMPELTPAMVLTAPVCATRPHTGPRTVVRDSGGPAAATDGVAGNTTTWRVATALGYADGLPRAAAGLVDAWLSGARRRVVSPVRLDGSAVEVAGAVPATGEQLTFFGRGADGQPTANEWAAALGTDPREIVTRVGSRVPRVYLSPELIGGA